MTSRLLALAAAFLARLGFILLSLGEPGTWAPAVALVFARVTAWIPFRPLGLPGDYSQPTAGGVP